MTPNPSAESSSAASNVLFWWQLFTGTLLFSFALSCVSQFAQFYQMTIDQEASDKLREHLPPSVRTSLLSPGGSGRLVLPPPTPKTVKKSPKNSLRSGKKRSLSPLRNSPKEENDWWIIRVEKARNRLDWIGLSWIELDWVGLSWIE